MPWSNQSGGGGGGPWGKGGGGGGPWGQGPSGGGGQHGQQPDLEDLIKRGQDRIKQALPGGGLPGPLMFLIGALAIGAIAFYAFTFRVNPDEIGVVRRFGEYTRKEAQGLHYRWPYPIEDVNLVKVTRVNRTEIGFRGGDERTFRGGGSRDVPEESLMLTGDENIVDVDFVVLWQIKDAPSYLFNIQGPDNTVKEVAESAMREIVGKSDVQDVLAEKRQETERSVQELIQKTLDGYKAGVQITQVQLQKVDPPQQVIDAFRDVQAARADQERLQNEARTYANRVIPEARGEAQRILQAAEAFKSQQVAEAQGQANRFLKVYEEYKKAPEVTRRRIFLETMERVYGGMDKIIIDGKAGAGGSGVVPYLPLNELTKPKQGPGAR
jgi:membrane protease subunit HflK